ncbi:unnamed protein product [Pleuronectes platessa]|uniref:Uncharacterized protein n=1 Tax=Pleuronectes platessa TaxID=8262 RepID=A0A9N7U6N0_PLEPL|nr:unnamed protein product [Pleuronectes platessa]
MAPSLRAEETPGDFLLNSEALTVKGLGSGDNFLSGGEALSIDSGGHRPGDTFTFACTNRAQALAKKVQEPAILNPPIRILHWLRCGDVTGLKCSGLEYMTTSGNGKGIVQS